MKPELRAALAYARTGYAAVFPVSVDYRTGKKPKSPVFQGWRRQHPIWNPDGRTGGLTCAVRDPSIIERSWPTRPHIGPGVVFDDLVIDLDEPDQLDMLVGTYPEVAAAPRQRTPSGGVHFGPLRVPPEWPPISTGEWPKSAPDGERLGELRGLGKAYVVAAPSRIDGRAYTWERPLPKDRADLPEASESLLHYLTDPPQRAERTPQRGRSRLHTVTAAHLIREVKYAEAALQRQADELAAMQPDTGRNMKLNAAAYSLGHKIASGHLERALVEDALLKAAADCELPAWEAERTMRSGLEAGMLEPWEGLEPEPRYPRAQRVTGEEQA